MLSVSQAPFLLLCHHWYGGLFLVMAWFLLFSCGWGRQKVDMSMGCVSKSLPLYELYQ